MTERDVFEPENEVFSEEQLQKKGSPLKATTEKLVTQLRQALQSDSSFPTSAKAVTQLRTLASDPKTTSNQIAEIILKDPSLATRLLHVVNSSFYRRAKPIMTVSQAVLQFGMEPLIEIFSGMNILKHFANNKTDIHFGNCLKKTICTSLVTSSVMPIFTPENDSKNELGYLLGMFSEIGSLTLAHYFPRIYETAAKQSELNGQKLDQCLRDIIGIDGAGLSLEVIRSLDVPPLYKSALHASAHPENTAKAAHSMERIVTCLTISHSISDALVIQHTPTALEQALEEAAALGMDSHKLRKALSRLPEQFNSYCEALNIKIAPLPDFLSDFSYEKVAPDTKTDSGGFDRLNSFIDEVKAAVNEGAPSATVITIVMETLAWGLSFDRVLLLLKNKATDQLVGRTLIGQSSADPKSIIRPMKGGSDRFAPDAKAIREDQPVFNGDPIFANGWPIVALPVGLGENCIGVIYADRLCVDLTADGELSDREKAAVSIMSDLINKSLVLAHT